MGIGKTRKENNLQNHWVADDTAVTQAELVFMSHTMHKCVDTHQNRATAPFLEGQPKKAKGQCMALQFLSRYKVEMTCTVGGHQDVVITDSR